MGRRPRAGFERAGKRSERVRAWPHSLWTCGHPSLLGARAVAAVKTRLPVAVEPWSMHGSQLRELSAPQHICSGVAVRAHVAEPGIRGLCSADTLGPPCAVVPARARDVCCVRAVSCDHTPAGDTAYIAVWNRIQDPKRCSVKLKNHILNLITPHTSVTFERRRRRASTYQLNWQSGGRLPPVVAYSTSGGVPARLAQWSPLPAP
jgi:hypothetical protein